MIFLRRESFREYIKRYPVTTTILCINIFIFVLMIIDGGFKYYETNTLIRFGAMFNVPPYDQELWRYISSIFLHIGLKHLLFNSFAILVFTPPLELLLGKVKYIILYLGGGIMGNIISDVLHNGTYISAGASGSIYGVFAAFLYIVLFRKQLLDAQSQKTIVIILVIGVIYSFVAQQVNVLAHLGGFIGGFILFGLMTRRR